MPFDRLKTFLDHLEARGDLKRVRVEVDPELEITEIVSRVIREGGPALLFERVKGSRFPLAINFLGSYERVEQILGMHPDALGERLVKFAADMMPPTASSLWKSRDLAKRLLSYRPRLVRSAPCQTVVRPDPDLGELPAVKCWPGDGGRFVTFPLVLTKSPVTNKSNVGIYRMHVFGRDTTGMHWQIQKGGGFHYDEAEKLGRPLPLVTVLGADPALMLAGMFPLPEGLEEIAFAGILRGRRTRLTRALTCDLTVPADAEFILEGEVPPYDRQLEGPFGDHLGHYSGAADFPVFRVRTITHRDDAIYPAAIVGKPPQEDRFMGDATQMVMGPLIKLVRPEVSSLWAYYETGFHNLLVAAVRPRYTKEAIRSAMGLLGEGQLSLTKCLILVDSNVDVKSFPDVLRAICTNFNPRENFMLVSKAPLDTLDFTSFEMHLGSRMILDATGSRAQYSGGAANAPGAGAAVRGPCDNPVTADPKDLAPHVMRWRLWEDTLLAVQLDLVAPEAVRESLRRLVTARELSGVKMIAVVSPDVDIDNDVELLWGVFTRFDPARDVQFARVSMAGVVPVYEGTMGIDATWKPGYPEPLEMNEDIVKKVDSRWQDYWK
jgi:4-hydroxy-3-polyprenylbenzoate decarboxylase